MEGEADDHMVVGPPGTEAAEGAALKPRERSLLVLILRLLFLSLGEDDEEVEATQSAKAPESDCNLLVVATAADGSPLRNHFVLYSICFAS